MLEQPQCTCIGTKEGYKDDMEEFLQKLEADLIMVTDTSCNCLVYIYKSLKTLEVFFFQIWDVTTQKQPKPIEMTDYWIHKLLRRKILNGNNITYNVNWL